MVKYISRTLDCFDDQGNLKTVADSELLHSSRSQVILGDPGIGKSELLREIARRYDVTLTPASSLRWSNIKAVGDRPVLIDGLDELAQRRDGDALGEVLRQLQSAGWPRFILSCRAADWDLRSESDLKVLPQEPPVVYSLKPFGQEEALFFLKNEFPRISANTLVEHLYEHDLQELMGNPLTLGLLGRVASENAGLPITKSDLFLQATYLLVQEENEEHEESAQSQDPDEVLKAAGALCAVYLLTAAPSISRRGAGRAKPEEIRARDVQKLPGASLSQTALGTRIFRSIGKADIFVPVHRVIAEYLGALWLARETENAKCKKRLLALLTSRGTVPASLRGLHAWLSYHSPDLAPDIIDTDPYGVLRYTGAEKLSDRATSHLFNALLKLADENPYFRAGDWRKTSIRCLLRPEFAEDIRAILLSTEDGAFHLRALFSEGIKGTSIVTVLERDLRQIVYSQEHYFSERQDASEALWEYLSHTEQAAMIAGLKNLADSDSTRLAADLLQSADFSAIGVELFVDTLLADTGLTISPIDRSKVDKAVRVKNFDEASKVIPDESVPECLDYLALVVSEFIRSAEYDAEHDISVLMLSLVDRVLTGGVRDARCIWRWLSCLADIHRVEEQYCEKIKTILDEDSELRRELIKHIAFTGVERGLSSRLIFIHPSVLSFLNPSRDDTEWLIKQMAEMDNTVQRNRESWMHFISWHRQNKVLKTSLLKYARAFAGEDRELTEHAFGRRKKPEWEKEEAKRKARFKRSQKEKFSKIRASYADQVEVLKSGHLNMLYHFSNAYLGRFRDLQGQDGPRQRLVYLYGDELADSALIGFEAILYRDDLPSDLEVSKSFAGGTEFHCVRPVLVGLIEKRARGEGLENVPSKTLGLSLRALQETYLLSDEVQDDGLREDLEDYLLNSDAALRAFLSTWSEPLLYDSSRAGRNAFYRLRTETKWFPVSAPLVAEWLSNCKNLPVDIQTDLLKVLLNSDRIDILREITTEKNKSTYNSYDELILWLAIEFQVDFENFDKNARGVGNDFPDFIWLLRELYGEVHKGNQFVISARQAHFIITEFRRVWPYIDRFTGPSWGNRNGSDASEYIRSAITGLSHHLTPEALVLMEDVVLSEVDSYTNIVKLAKSNQRQQIAESDYTPCSLEAVAAVLSGGRPQTAEDLFVTALDMFADLEAWLHGDETTPLKHFWPSGEPLSEEDGRDLLVNYLQQFCRPLGIETITEKRMLNEKRADIILQSGSLQLPVEVKGQWHKDIWEAANSQLDRLYTNDPRGGRFGIYLIFWFGREVPPRKAIRKLPTTNKEPVSKSEMCSTIVSGIPSPRRSQLGVLIIDVQQSAS